MEGSNGIIKTPLSRKPTERRLRPRRAAKRSRSSELVLEANVPERAGKIIGARIISVQCAGEANRRVDAKHVVHAADDRQTLERECIVVGDRKIVVGGRLER